MQPPRSFLWHDYETFGTDPALDRPAQFAAQRTDAKLNACDDPVEWYCTPADDVLPHPSACLVTGITPQQALRKGICEAEFAGRICAEMSEPGTCSAGYNSLRFDDEVTRHVFYRSLLDPYAREWQGGNTRWDLIDLCRMCYALRPGGIQWPVHESGIPSFRLEDLTAANRIRHAGAHRALADVQATIGLARLLRDRQPRLFHWALNLRDRKLAMDLLDPAHPEPVLHTSARFPAARGCTSIVLPLALHPDYRRSVIVFDLMADPTPLLEQPADALHDLVFTPRADLPDDIERLPLKAVKTNAVPMLAPLGTLADADTGRIGLDPELCREHAQRLLPHLESIRYKVMEVFGQPGGLTERDPDLMLYSAGFFTREDRQLMDRVRKSAPAELGELDFPFRDPRLPEMLFRFRARNYPDTLTPAELERWNADRRRRLLEPENDRQLGYREFREALARARREHAEAPGALEILDRLEAWSLDLGLASGAADTGRA